MPLCRTQRQGLRQANGQSLTTPLSPNLYIKNSARRPCPVTSASEGPSTIPAAMDMIDLGAHMNPGLAIRSHAFYSTNTTSLETRLTSSQNFAILSSPCRLVNGNTGMPRSGVSANVSSLGLLQSRLAAQVCSAAICAGTCRVLGYKR